MRQVAASNNSNSQASTGVAGLMNMVAAPDASGGIGHHFKSLISQMGNDQDAAQSNSGQQPAADDQDAAINAQASSPQQQVTDLLAKVSTTGSADLNIKVLLAAGVDPSDSKDGTDPSDPSADLISEIAGLMQKFPALQELFTGKIDTQQLQSIGDALAKGGSTTPPDFSALNALKLPADLTAQLQALAQDPSESSDFQDLTTQLLAKPALADEVSQMAQSFAALMQQNASANANAAQAAGVVSAQTNRGIVQNLQAVTNNNSAQIVSNQTANDKSRPQGLLKSLDRTQQANLQPSNVQQQAAQDNSAADADTDSASAQTASADASKTVAANADANETFTTTSFFTPNANGTGAPNLTAEQTNAWLQTGKSNVTIGNVADAYNAQLANNAAAASPSAQIAIQMQRNLQTNNNNFMMQLHPEELGRIQVEMKFDGNRVQTKITAEKEETLNSLKQDSGALTKALNSAGLQADAGSMEFSLGNSQQHFANQSQKNNNSDNQFGTLLATNTTDETSSAAAAGSQWTTLGTGHVDVRL